MNGWMIGADGLAGIHRLNPTLAETFFNNPNTYVLHGAPPGWHAVSVAKFNSLTSYEADKGKHVAALLDLESWVLTSHDEQLKPRETMAAFVTLAQQRGVATTILTPARDLTGVSGSEFARKPGETPDHAYLRSGVIAACGPATIAEVQTQGEEGSINTVTNLFEGARMQRPDKPLYAGLTDLRPGNSAAMLLRCYMALMAIPHPPDGIWLNTSGSTAHITLQFLESIK